MEERRKVPGQGFTMGTVTSSLQTPSWREASGKLETGMGRERQGGEHWLGHHRSVVASRGLLL